MTPSAHRRAARTARSWRLRTRGGARLLRQALPAATRATRRTGSPPSSRRSPSSGHGGCARCRSRSAPCRESGSASSASSRGAARRRRDRRRASSPDGRVLRAAARAARRAGGRGAPGREGGLLLARRAPRGARRAAAAAARRRARRPGRGRPTAARTSSTRGSRRTSSAGRRRRVAAARRAAGSTPAPTLPAGARTLSPSDFGFHNALLRPDGTLVFIDFEYFGWDDPAKTVADFFLQPQAPLAPERLASAFLQRLPAVCGRAPASASGSPCVYPLLSLKWCLIMLNPFLRPPLPGREAPRSACAAARRGARALLGRACARSATIGCFPAAISVCIIPRDENATPGDARRRSTPAPCTCAARSCDVVRARPPRARRLRLLGRRDPAGALRRGPARRPREPALAATATASS